MECTWEERAAKILDKYRRREDQIAPSELHLSNELVEVAFQTASQLIVGLLTPEVTPLFPRCFFGRSPLTFSGLFTASLLAKLMLDCSLWFELAIFRWLPRLPRSQMIAPWHRVNVEISCLSTLLGLGLGHLSNMMGRSFERGHFQVFDRFWIFGNSILVRIPRFVLRESVGRILKHIPLCCTVGLAPVVTQNLLSLGKEAQQRRRFIVVVALYRLRWNFRELWKDYPEWCEGDAPIPNELQCPITRMLFVDPVVVGGLVFERHAAERWVAKKCRHPILSDPCTQEDIKPAPEMKELVKEFAAQYALQLRVPVLHK